MSLAVTFENYRPAPRYDSEPWTEVQIEESPVLGDAEVWTLIDTITLNPVDADPTDPAARDFTTPNGTAADYWYRVTFVDGNGDESLPTTPVQNSVAASPYADTTELARILKIRTPTAEQEVAMERVLETAAGEINSEIDLDDETELSGWQLSLAAEVNLERAVEHWRQQEAAFGLVAIGGDLGGVERVARDTWDRHANKLAPLKGQWGLA